MLIAEPFPFTLLSLPRYAAILGIDPVHFQGAYGTSIFPLVNRCSDVWPRYSWQNSDMVSQMDLALEIGNAEKEIAEQLGWFPAPWWIAQEPHMMPRFHRPEYFDSGSYNVRGQHKSVKTLFGKVIEAGQRKVTLIGSITPAGGGTLSYTDEDHDGFPETATVTMATSYTNACDVKIYHYGQNGAQEWEVRPARSKTISGGIFTGVFFAWLFIDPDLQSWYPGTVNTAILVDTAANYVTSVDVYYEENDPTAASAAFYWEHTGHCDVCNDEGCTACQLIEQEGCLYIRDAEQGVVVPVPATYGTGWSTTDWAVCRDPDQVKLYYYAGNLDNRWLRGVSCEPLSDFWAQTIAYLATARLERPFCACGNSTALANLWREDMSASGTGITSHSLSLEILDNPFGTHRGEIMAWQRISRIMGRHVQIGIGAI